MEEKTTIKRITYTSRKGGRRTLDKDGNEVTEQKEIKEEKKKDSVSPKSEIRNPKSKKEE